MIDVQTLPIATELIPEALFVVITGEGEPIQYINPPVYGYHELKLLFSGEHSGNPVLIDGGNIETGGVLLTANNRVTVLYFDPRVQKYYIGQPVVF